MGVETSSPRPWGCFPALIKAISGNKVFPTPVGVFPDKYEKLYLTLGLPHARGGVSGR